jgi:hypothetical protein
MTTTSCYRLFQCCQILGYKFHYKCMCITLICTNLAITALFFTIIHVCLREKDLAFYPPKETIQQLILGIAIFLAISLWLILCFCACTARDLYRNSQSKSSAVHLCRFLCCGYPPQEEEEDHVAMVVASDTECEQEIFV